ncbi:hypothetical protein EVAR_30619_1 [Eumeta japonica]|uniref:Uncharacterized protein n=1 Tax=Eumeta variegata TaxID=151549 RepID=A0A4C1WAI9_EUMVA|nr:hypothetical protein EVAR_30619_1 [Eumeta japonica]
MHRRNGTALSLVLAILERKDQAKEIFKNFSRVNQQANSETNNRESPTYPSHRYRTAASVLRENINTITSIPKVVRSAEVANIAAKFRKANRGVDRLKIILENQELINKLEDLSRALQHKVSTRMQEVRNDSWNDLMVEISPNHKVHWRLAKALKTEGAVSTLTLRKPDNYIAFDDREKAECLADSIEQ